jgi:hypothetical protein
MISTVTIERMSAAKLAVEHPDDWTEENVKAAVEARALDIGGMVPYWSATTKSAIGAVTLGEDPREVDDEDEPMGDAFKLAEEG